MSLSVEFLIHVPLYMSPRSDDLANWIDISKHDGGIFSPYDTKRAPFSDPRASILYTSPRADEGDLSPYKYET